MIHSVPNVLVTGSSGFIGRHLVQELGVQSVFQMTHGEKGISGKYVVSADLLDENRLPVLNSRIDVIYHLAGNIRSNEQDELQILTNVIALAKLCGVKRIVYASTCAVYGNSVYGKRVDEISEVAPQSSYAKGKLAGEEFLKRVVDSSDTSVTVLRYFNPYGPGQLNDMVVPSMISKARSGAMIEVFGDGEQVRDFIFVEDLVKATLAAVRYGGRYEVFNVGTGHALSINELARNIVMATGINSKIRHIPVPQDRKNLEVEYCVASINRITSLCNWRPIVSLQDGLKRTVLNQ